MLHFFPELASEMFHIYIFTGEQYALLLRGVRIGIYLLTNRVALWAGAKAVSVMSAGCVAAATFCSAIFVRHDFQNVGRVGVPVATL